MGGQRAKISIINVQNCKTLNKNKELNEEKGKTTTAWEQTERK